MKYLKMFNESLSQEDRNEISQYCKDIFLDLKDDGITVNTSWSVNFKWIIIEFSRAGRDFSVSQYKDELRMLSSYLKSLGFVFNSQQKYGQKNKFGYYNSQMIFRFIFSYRLDDELNESVYNMANILRWGDKEDEEIHEIKSIFMDVVDEFDLEQYDGQDEDSMNYGIYYDIDRNSINDNIIEIYLRIIDPRTDDPHWDRFLSVIEHLKFFRDRLYHMGFSCDYPTEDIGDILLYDGFITIQIEKIELISRGSIRESLDSLPKDIQDIIDNFPKSHRYKTERGEISLIYPCLISQDMYEIYCIEGDFFEDVERYSTLEEAEFRIDELIGWFQN